MHDDSPFLHAICEAPFDDGPRLVWADHLDERGDPRGEFIRVQCELAALDAEALTCESEDRAAAITARTALLWRRERELWWANWEPWTEGIRSVLRPLSYGPVNCTLPDSSQARWEFRRGFVASVTLTTEQFLGGPCGRCGGRGYTLPSADSFLIERKGCSACGGDGWKDGTGRVEGLAAALFRAAPVTEVRLSDRRPVRLTWWNLPPIGTEHPDHLGPLFAQLPPARREHRLWKVYESEAAALSALSAACVAVGRDRANLPALSRVVSADSPR